ncbi:endolysin [Bordetella phage vB_BbrM_PHB04]|uniref:Endolysin n=1 Tax=Bordetella phage vB_BbrM_PHB04 TaxID=2029657 RepID=A0A291LA05_9CAUD|nr:endolysin [Bordetella phage vB_BbrM_PHB04]ATI15735.1 endolysin [Bordetella phage vB_BbrM_PHB04]
MRTLRHLLVMAVAMIASCASSAVYAQNVRTFVPPAAHKLLPELRTVQENIWPTAPMPSFMAAQIEQESCISLTHSKCWNTRSELKTSREYGFGLGQITIAYRADGSVRFNKFQELRQEYASLRGWAWENRYDAKYQLTAIVEMDKGIYGRVSDAATSTDRLAFTLSAYNGGESGLRQDRLLCKNTDGCDRSRWFGHVEHTSLKSKAKWQGYGASPFHINREYVDNVINVRRPKYEPFFEGRS